MCRRCLTAFSSEQILFDHTSRCINQQPTNITFSWKDQLKFEENVIKIPLPIEVYADFNYNNQPTNNPKVIFKQIPIAVVFYLISPCGNCYYSYFGESCVTWFVIESMTLEHIASEYFKTNKPLEISPHEEESFQQSKMCWLCEGSLLDCGDKVRDHDHLTGKYRGEAHSECNINVNKSSQVLFPYFCTISLGMIVILYLKNSYHKLTKWGMNQK